MPRAPGTVLPTPASLDRGAAHAACVARDQKRVGDALGCRAQRVGGEIRYYANSEWYATVARDLTVRWFTVRADGDYPAAAP